MMTSFENIDNAVLEKLTSEYNVIDADNFLRKLVGEYFPFGFKKISEEVFLLKILYLKNENEFDRSRLSPFYFANQDNIENMKCILDGAQYEGEPFLIKVKTDKTNIDVEETLRNNLLYQFEYSTILKPNSEIEIISVERLK
jgi:dephospho-CoA kinase